jgi:hypothetical protein
MIKVSEIMKNKFGSIIMILIVSISIVKTQVKYCMRDYYSPAAKKMLQSEKCSQCERDKSMISCELAKATESNIPGSTELLCWYSIEKSKTTCNYWKTKNIPNYSSVCDQNDIPLSPNLNASIQDGNINDLWKICQSGGVFSPEFFNLVKINDQKILQERKEEIEKKEREENCKQNPTESNCYKKLINQDTTLVTFYWYFASLAYNENIKPDFYVTPENNLKTKAIMTYNKNKNEIIVAFRGTDNLINWLNNLNFETKGFFGMAVHSGFIDSYLAIGPALIQNLKYLLTENATASVTLLGHSLGGALATLASHEISFLLGNTIKKLNLITYGSPRVGYEPFAFNINRRINGLNIRVTYADDIVTVTPPFSFAFKHVGTQYHYINEADGFIYNKFEDTKENRITVGDHKLYGNIRLNENLENFLNKNFKN